MTACEFVGSNIDFYVPLVLKRADLFLECLKYFFILLVYRKHVYSITVIWYGMVWCMVWYGTVGRSVVDRFLKPTTSQQPATLNVAAAVDKKACK